MAEGDKFIFSVDNLPSVSGVEIQIGYVSDGSFSTVERLNSASVSNSKVVTVPASMVGNIIALRLSINTNSSLTNYKVRPTMCSVNLLTNKQLTESKISISDLQTVVAASSDFADFQTRIAAL